MKSKKLKVGRPKLAKGEGKEVRSVRFTPDELMAYQSMADKRGISLSQWIRASLKSASS